MPSPLTRGQEQLARTLELDEPRSAMLVCNEDIRDPCIEASAGLMAFGMVWPRFAELGPYCALIHLRELASATPRPQGSLPFPCGSARSAEALQHQHLP